jgi:hypothetical protein
MADEKTKKPGKKIAALHIKSVSAQGFRRCGHSFTHDGALYARDLFSDEQIERLKSERQLSVMDAEVDEADLITTDEGQS